MKKRALRKVQRRRAGVKWVEDPVGVTCRLILMIEAMMIGNSLYCSIIDHSVLLGLEMLVLDVLVCECLDRSSISGTGDEKERKRMRR